MSGRFSQRGCHKRRGFALLTAVFLVFVLTFVAAGVQTSARGTLSASLDARYRLRAKWAAESAVNAAVQDLVGAASIAGMRPTRVELVGAVGEARIAPATDSLTLALFPHAATESVWLVTGTGTAQRGTRSAALSRQSLLVRVSGDSPPRNVRRLQWLHGSAQRSH